MDSSLLPKFKSIEESLDQLVAELSKYPAEVLAKKPAPNAWSVLEILQHLMIAERGSFTYVKKKTSYPDTLKKAGFADHFRKMQLYLFLHVPIKIKAPAVVNENQFDPDISFEKLIAEWRALRKELKEFLDHVPNDWLGKLTYRHTVAGRMTFDGMLLFFRDHLVRHKKQIERTLAKVSG